MFDDFDDELELLCQFGYNGVDDDDDDDDEFDVFGDDD